LQERKRIIKHNSFTEEEVAKHTIRSSTNGRVVAYAVPPFKDAFWLNVRAYQNSCLTN